METLQRMTGDCVRVSRVAITHERNMEEMRAGIPGDLVASAWRFQWQGRTLDAIGPGSDYTAIDLESGEIVHYRGLLCSEKAGGVA